MTGRIFIETDRLYLRQWKASDEQPYIAINADPEVMAFFPAVLSADETRSHIEKCTRHIETHGYGYFALERKSDGAFLGFTGLSHPGFEAFFTPCTEIGWRLAYPFWGNGYATEAAGATLVFAFREWGLKEVYAFTSIHNTRSEKLMRKIGMENQGTFQHPSLPLQHRLQQHVLYKISNP